MKKERNSNIELLRIISMLLIISYHIIRRYGDYEGSFTNLKVSTYLTETVLGIWGLLGVYLFVAISAWFLCTSKFRLKHILSILFQTVCYIAVFEVIEAKLHYSGFGPVVKYSLIGIHDTYLFKNAHWFVAPYLMMCFMAPFLNLLIGKINKKQYETLLIVLTGLFVYVQLAGSFFSQSGMFLYIYLVCAYLKKHSNKKCPYFLWGGYSATLILGFCILKDNCGTSGLIAFVNNYTSRLFGNFSGISLITAFTAICFLMAAVQAKERHNKLINTLGGLTFGVYLFHETFIYIGDESLSLIDIVHKELLKGSWIVPESNWYLMQIVLLTIVTFIAGITVEYVRKRIVHEPFMRIVDKLDCSKFDRWINMEDK